MGDYDDEPTVIFRNGQISIRALIDHPGRGDGQQVKAPEMSERLETLKKARERMIEERDAHAKVLAAPFDRDKAERARAKFTEI